MIRLRFSRSSTTPAMGPARTAGSAREIMIQLMTRPDRVDSSARLNTAMLLKWSPISLTTWPIQMRR